MLDVNMNFLEGSTARLHNFRNSLLINIGVLLPLSSNVNKRFLYNVIKIKSKLNEKTIYHNYYFYKLSIII